MDLAFSLALVELLGFKVDFTLSAFVPLTLAHRMRSVCCAVDWHAGNAECRRPAVVVSRLLPPYSTAPCCPSTDLGSKFPHVIYFSTKKKALTTGVG